MSDNVSGSLRRLLLLLPAALLLALWSGCDAPNPNANTPTSGRLVVYVDEAYAPLIRVLADTFMMRSPNARVTVQELPARMAVQELFNSIGRDTSKVDTGTTYAAVIGRKLLGDEQGAVQQAGLESKEYVLGYDAVSIVVPGNSPLSYSTVENLRTALKSPAATLSMLDSSAGAAPARFLLPDQNAATYAFLRMSMLGDSDVTASARYFGRSDSLLDAVAAGEGIGLIGWYRAHMDSARLRTLPLGFVDTTGKKRPPTVVHTTSLVTGAYPIKQPLVGYTFGSNNSLAVGFLAWLSRSQDAQYYLANHNVQPENVKIRIVLPPEE